MMLDQLPEDYQASLAFLNGDEIFNRWAYRWYDGPLSGVCLYKDKPYWFESQHNDDVRRRVDEEGQAWNDWYKPFVLIELTQEQFQQLSSQQEPSAFLSGIALQITHNRIVGWFEWLWVSAEQE